MPVGLTGLLFEHTLRTIFAKPLVASIFLFVDGLILLAGERARRRAEAVATAAATAPPVLMPIAGGSVDLDAEAVLNPCHGGARSLEELADAYASDVRISRIPYRDADLWLAAASRAPAWGQPLRSDDGRGAMARA